MNKIDGVSIDDLAREFGSPLFVASAQGIINGEGAWAEAASGFEYEIARRMGVPGSSIVLNGPYKKKEELGKAVKEGALINADHMEELELLEEIAREEGRSIDIGIRVSMETGIDQMPDRFGFGIESGEAARAVERASRNKL